MPESTASTPFKTLDLAAIKAAIPHRYIYFIWHPQPRFASSACIQKKLTSGKTLLYIAPLVIGNRSHDFSGNTGNKHPFT